ncbi:SurA N-terminal domain-containing protein [Marinobacter sp.]|uniref:SurA N-terminal domain-containing protein n=1 Tax=Marinobacter sp. TaxID=50741 RepID=UPI0019FE4486|nr:SurA N-terminal domain-containing protein [Marinobacter sp.]MBE0484599.1 SurA N-terminal domain-containing protein [Marinobacter sp.]
MLQDIRDNAQGTIAKVIIGLLIVSLSIWGMDAIIGGFSGEPEVASVNGESITEREFLRTVQLETQQRLSQMENPDSAMLDEDQIRQDVLEALIQERVLILDAQEQGLELSDDDIDALITQMPQFQIGGQFNRDRFVATVRNFGMGVGEFRENMRKNYVINQIRASIAQTGLVAGDNASQLLRIQNQTRDFRVLTVSADSLADQIVVTEDDVRAYYDDNAAEFREPEQVNVAYISLSLGALADAVEVGEGDLQAYYEERAEEYAREERRAAHILIDSGAEAEATLATILERLDAGESFAELAQEFSVDTISARDGGDLGFAGRGVYDESFEEALFALAEGEISEPVETSFGVHLIRLDDVRRSDVPSFDELRAELRDELARTLASERFAEVRAQLADAAYAADDLAGPAEELGLEVRSVDGVTRDGGVAPFDHAGLVRQLFSGDVLEGGFNTELIDVGDNVSVVARVREYFEPRQRELASVRDDIQARLEARKTREALEARVDELMAALESGDQPEALNAGEWQQFEGQGRDGSGLSQFVVQRAFAMSRPEADKPSVGKAVGQREAAIILVDAVQEGDVDTAGVEFQQLRQFLTQLEGQREYAAYQQYLRNEAKVDRN